MEKQELELAQSILKLAETIQHDRLAERETEKRKFKWLCITLGIVTSVFIISMSYMWIIEIKESYNYDSFEITNEASAKIESTTSE